MQLPLLDVELDPPGVFFVTDGRSQFLDVVGFSSFHVGHVVLSSSGGRCQLLFRLSDTYLLADRRFHDDLRATFDMLVNHAGTDGILNNTGRPTQDGWLTTFPDFCSSVAFRWWMTT